MICWWLSNITLHVTRIMQVFSVMQYLKNTPICRIVNKKLKIVYLAATQFIHHVNTLQVGYWPQGQYLTKVPLPAPLCSPTLLKSKMCVEHQFNLFRLAAPHMTIWSLSEHYVNVFHCRHLQDLEEMVHNHALGLWIKPSEGNCRVPLLLK